MAAQAVHPEPRRGAARLRAPRQSRHGQYLLRTPRLLRPRRSWDVRAREGEGEAQARDQLQGRRGSLGAQDLQGTGAVGLWSRASLRPPGLGQVTGEGHAGEDDEGEARACGLPRVGGCSGVRLRDSCRLPTPLGRGRCRPLALGPWHEGQGAPAAPWFPVQTAYACGPGPQSSLVLVPGGSPGPSICPYSSGESLSPAHPRRPATHRLPPPPGCPGPRSAASPALGLEAGCGKSVPPARETGGEVGWPRFHQLIQTERACLS